MSISPRRPSPALIVAFVALLVALGGTGYAASGHKHHSGAAPSGAAFVAVAKDSPSNTNPNKEVTVSCPKGRHAVGGGSHLHYPSSTGPIPLAVSQSRPNPDGSARPTGWVAAANATAPYASNWNVEVHVICAR